MASSVAGEVRFQWSSDQSLLVYFGDRISLEVNSRVVSLLRLLEDKPIVGIRNLNPAYCSLLVTFDALKLQHSELEAILREYLSRLDAVDLPEIRDVMIPVCYGGEHGPDLEEVAALHQLAPSQVIELHTSCTYTVYFLGFVPGFAYLGGLSDSLATPRLAIPRTRVPPGSVGIGGSQTGIYPFATPGGWRLLGRTPISVFSADRLPMSSLSIGDRVRFTPITNDEFAKLQQQEKAR